MVVGWGTLVTTNCLPRSAPHHVASSGAVGSVGKIDPPSSLEAVSADTIVPGGDSDETSET